MIERSQIQELADRIAKEFNPERIILFGSNASGTPSSDSDVDLLQCGAKLMRSRKELESARV